MSTPVIEATDVDVVLGGRPILRQVDFAVRPGEVVALLGANGSGKSTLVKTLVGLNPLAGGAVRLFGTSLATFRDWQRVGYVPQRSGVMAGVPATVTEVVASGRLSRRTPLLPARRVDRAAVRHALEVVGLADRAKHQASTLSGGQQQRVLLARTLAGEPDLLLLDEPLAGVDLPSQEALADSIARLTETGATVVVVLHELGPFARLLQRAVVLREGRVAYDGPPQRAPGEGTGSDHHHPADTPPVLRPRVTAPLDGGS